MKGILSFGLLFLLGSAAAQGDQVTFSPLPPVAGEPITITYHGAAFSCLSEGTLELQGISGNHIFLKAIPPECPVLAFPYNEYTATATIGPLPAGTYFVQINLADSGHYHPRQRIEVKSAPACRVTETSLCLGGGRFEVTGEWTDFDGNDGVARTAPDDFRGLGDYGTLWFFAAQNPEMVAKVIDACSFNGYYWVFLSPASTVKYDITVRDVRTGQQKTYSKALGTVPTLVADTTAFPCGLGAQD